MSTTDMLFRLQATALKKVSPVAAPVDDTVRKPNLLQFETSQTVCQFCNGENAKETFDSLEKQIFHHKPMVSHIFRSLSSL